MGFKTSVVNKSAMQTGAMEAGDPVPQEFIIVDNGDSTYSAMGVDAAGNAVDISALATLAASSVDPTILTVDSPIGMSFAVRGVGPISTAKVATTITMNPNPDGTPAPTGPFSADIDMMTSFGPDNSIVVTPGPVTAH